MASARNFLFFAVLIFAVLVYSRLPKVVDPSVHLCGKTTVFAPSSASDFLPGVCREVLVSHQEHITTSVYDCGPENAHQSVIMLHGFPDNAKTFRKQVDPFIQKGFRVLIPTMRGYEPSSQIGSYHITSLATDILCITDALGIDKFHVIGHDWGALVGQSLAITNPQKLFSFVSVAVPPSLLKHGARLFLSYPMQMLNSWYIQYFQIPLLPEITLTKTNFLLNYLLSSWSPSFSWSQDTHANEILDTFGRPGVATAAVSYYRQNMNLALIIKDTIDSLFSGEDYLRLSHPTKGKIGVHTLEVTGRDDGCIKTELYNEQFDDVYLQTSRRSMIRLSGGHFIHYESPEDFNSQVFSFYSTLPRQLGSGK